MAKKGFLSTLASAFVEVEEDGTKQEQSVVPVPGVTPASSPSNVVGPAMQETKAAAPADGSSISTKEIDPELFDRLCGVIEESNLPGPDYVELTEAANSESMKAYVKDESARYISAFVAMKATNQGFGKKVVLNSIEEYKKILDGEQFRGNTEWQKQWDENVTQQEQDVKSARAEIERLRKEIADKEKFVSEKEASLDGIKSSLTAKRDKFNNTFERFFGQLMYDKEFLSQILPD